MGHVSMAGVRICGAALLKSAWERLPGAGAMSKEKAEKNGHKIWARVSREEKERIEEEAENRGCSISDLVRGRVLGRAQVAHPEHRRAVRQIVSACHALKHSSGAGGADPEQLEALVDAARSLLSHIAAETR
jgi:uncharacterized protein (DUF1778 family)